MPEKEINVPGYAFLTSCSAVDQLLPLVLTEDDADCQLARSLSTFCGCPPPEDSCNLCPDGSAVAFPDLEVDWLSDQFGGFVPTCEMVEAYVASSSTTDPVCVALQLTSSYCGCPALDNHCTACGGEPLKEEYRNIELPFLKERLYQNQDGAIPATCEMVYLAQYQVPQNDEICRQGDYVSFHCGCNDGLFEYFGTKNTTQQAALVWIPRCVGIISLIASLLILWNILRVTEKRASLYHQLVSTIAAFDIVTSLVWIVGAAAMNPIYPSTGMNFGVYGTHGNDYTCNAQGFFFQLGK